LIPAKVKGEQEAHKGEKKELPSNLQNQSSGGERLFFFPIARILPDQILLAGRK
jgi:hypothetical protein